MPREQTAATRPIPSLTEPFGHTGVTEEQLNDLTLENHAETQGSVAGYTMGLLLTPPTLVNEENGGTLLLPGSVGGANWQGAVADPEAGLMYVSCAVSPEVVGLISDPDRSSIRYVMRDAIFDGPLICPCSSRHGAGSARWI